MLHAYPLLWTYHAPAVLPRSCMRHPAQELSKLHRRLHQAATLVRFLDRQKNGTQGKHTTVVQDLSLPMHSSTSPALLQASVLSRLAQTSANWLRTCKRSGIMRPTPTWAAGSLRPRATGRSGGPAACARLGSRTGGRPQSKIAHLAATAPMMLAEQPALATMWTTITQRWQQSGTGAPMGKGHQRL